MNRPGQRAWRALHRKRTPARLSELPVQKLLAGVAGSEEQGRVIYEALGGDLSRLPELVQHLDTLPGIGGGTAFRVAAALELAARAGGHRSAGPA